MAARAAEDRVENVMANGWRATTLGQERTIARVSFWALRIEGAQQCCTQY